MLQWVGLVDVLFVPASRRPIAALIGLRRGLAAQRLEPGRHSRVVDHDRVVPQ
jgi:hypothetical protein